jgi:hypothetical protein
MTGTSATLASLRSYTAPSAAGLREVAVRQAAALRTVTDRPAGATRTVRPVRPTVATPAPARPASPTFAEVDALLAQIPTGRYALPRTVASGSGNMITFFEVRELKRTGKRQIVQLIGSTGDYERQPLRLNLQFHAARHILESIEHAAALYGRTAKECGFCAASGRTSPLSNSRSLAVGYGQGCAEKYGLPW